MGRAPTYDPKKIAIIIGGYIIDGFVDGDFVSAEKAGDAFAMKSGADGFVTRVAQNHPEGSITIKLMQSSPANAVLQTLYQADEATGQAAFPVTVKDLFGGDLVTTSQAWFRKIPNFSKGRDIGENEWVLDCADLTIIHGGNF